jgi:hypothetical protein
MLKLPISRIDTIVTSNTQARHQASVPAVANKTAPTSKSLAISFNAGLSMFFSKSRREYLRD